MIQICISRQLQTESANAALVDDTGCGKVAAAEKRGARGVGSDGSATKKVGHMWRCALALSHTLVQVFDHVSYILLYAGVTATGNSIEWVVV